MYSLHMNIRTVTDVARWSSGESVDRTVTAFFFFLGGGGLMCFSSVTNELAVRIL